MAKPVKLPVGEDAETRGVLRNLLNPLPVLHIVTVTVENPVCGTLSGFTLAAEDAAHAEDLADVLGRCPGVTSAEAREVNPWDVDGALA